MSTIHLKKPKVARFFIRLTNSCQQVLKPNNEF